MTVALLLLLILLLGAAAAAAWRASARGDAVRTGPVCGACGYSALGLASTTCPECGSDLRAVGVLTPHVPSQGAGLVANALLFTLLLGFIAGVITTGLLALLPVRQTYERQVRLVSPQSKAYQEVVFRTHGTGWGPNRLVLPVEIELVPFAGGSNPIPSATPQPVATQPAPVQPTQPQRMTVRPDGGYQYAAPGAAPVTRPGGFGAAAVLDWMKALGFDTTQPALSEEAARIAGEARLTARRARRTTAGGGLSRFSSSSSGGDPGGQFGSINSRERADHIPPMAAVVGFVLFWVAVWACGIRYLARRGSPAPHRPATREAAHAA
jgi:hypothetical protein